VGLVVTDVEIVRETETEVLGVREMDRERVGLGEVEGGMANVPAKL
jgi:hypothetical protein